MGKSIYQWWKICMATMILLAVVVLMPRTVRAAGLSDFSNIWKTNVMSTISTYGKVPNTYLEKTGSGWQAVLADGNTIHIIDFNEDWEQISERQTEYELSEFGGYFSGEKYNFLVFGQQGSSDGTEIYRIIKYDKDFNRLDALSIPYEDCYTNIPFAYGGSSIAENGNELTIYTSKLRPDGHQSNMLIQIDTESMTAIDEENLKDSFQDVHVSHSFREYVKYDGDKPVFADLGDAYPRCVCLQPVPGREIEMLSIEGEIGDNVTNTELSGLEVTDSGYIVVGTQKKNDTNNIYISYVDKEAYEAKVTWLTDYVIYDPELAGDARIIRVSDDLYAVMWNETANGRQVKYVMVNGRGETVSSLKEVKGMRLTQCEPVMADGEAVWLEYVNGIYKVYSLKDFSCTGEFAIEDRYVPAENPWDGTVDTGWYDDGKEEFTLDSPAQLAGLAQLVNEGNTFQGKKVILGKDMFFNESKKIDQNWTSIASVDSGVEFQGVFDGQGHILYNLYITASEGGGLFGTIGENGIVKAVVVDQGYIQGSSIARTNKGWILFCENRSYVSTARDNSGFHIYYIGGICGINENLVYGCGNERAVKGYLDDGGIVGQNLDNGVIESCWNEGIVKSESGDAGGIAGRTYGKIHDCYNSGYVYSNLAGAAGICGMQINADSELYNCYNIGEISGDHTLDTICSKKMSGNIDNVYSLDYSYNTVAEILTIEQFKDPETIKLLQSGRVIQRWTAGTADINEGCIVPTARQDIENGVYKMLPEVINAVTEVSISLSDSGYQLKAFENASLGNRETKAVYSTDNTDILSVTAEGIINPEKEGAAVVKVTFPESEQGKEVGFDVLVTVSGMKGDVDGSGKVDIADLRLVLRAVCGKVELTDAQTSAADVETDGKVDIQDLRKILRFVCGKIESL